ncbi:MAG TPA: DUF2227 family putative metal-binding protein, partial [Pyrinomonadaceae bacterium]|nr:DUF2227 family putative metal-binding protein [Pyrinomonadaceae bacterium]
GIIFGTLIRVVYFALMLTIIACAAIYLRAALVASAPPDYGEIFRAWRAVEAGAMLEGTGRHVVYAALAGLWWGAASHTLTDVAWSVLRKGSEIF